MLHSLITLFWMIVLLAVFTGCGLFFLSPERFVFSNRRERLFFAFVCGEGIAGYLIFTLAATQFLTPAGFWTILSLMSLLAVAGWMTLRPIPRELLLSFGRPSAGTLLMAGALLFVIFVAILLSLTPETGRDALLYHLAAPKLYLEHGGFYLIPGNLFAQYPFHTEMLFTLGLFLQGDILAKGINLLFLLVLPLGMWIFVTNYLNNRCNWLLASVLLVTLPTVFATGHAAYSDLSTTIHVFAAILAFLNWQKRGGASWLVLSGTCAGLALACKFTVLILPFIGFLAVLRVLQQRGEITGKKLVRSLLLFFLPLMLTGAPYYLKSWVITGNPFYPYLFGLFGGAGLDKHLSYLLEGMTMYVGMGKGLLDYLFLPFNLSLRSDWGLFLFDGIIGPVFLLTLPLLVLRRPWPDPLKSIMIFSGLFFLFWAAGSQQLRYLLPIFPFLSLASCYALQSFAGQRVLHPLIIVVLGGCILLNTLEIKREVDHIQPLGYVLGNEAREDYLARLLFPYPMYRYVNEKLPPDAKVFLVYLQSWTFLCDRECYSDSIIEIYTLQKILQESATPEDVLNDFKVRGFTHLLYDSKYLLGDTSFLTEEQKRLFYAFRDRYLTPEKEMSFFHLFRLEGVRAISPVKAT